MRTIRGDGVSPGISMGHVLKLDEGLPAVYRIRLSGPALEREMARFEEALRETTEQLQRIRDLMEERLGKEHSLMVEAHIMILHDAHFSGAIRELIRKDRINADWAVKVITEQIQSVYADLEDPYFQEKVLEIRDISLRLLHNISGRAVGFDPGEYENIVLVSQEINLSMLNEKLFSHLKGIAVDKGGWTSHTSIIARSMGIPSVIHLRHLTELVSTGQFVIIDGLEGLLIIDPDAETIQQYRDILLQEPHVTGPLFPPCESLRRPGLSGVRVYLNAEYPCTLENCPESGVMGIGLFRSEFLCIGRHVREITVEEHAAIYADLARRVHPHPVNIRTFDLEEGRAGLESERRRDTHPAMGIRGIRLSLRHPGIFDTQLKGILLASREGNVRITFPFVTSVEEMVEGRQALREAAKGLGMPEDRLPPVGAMLEIPSNFFILDDLADHADFFTLGTNDLVQFTLALDRSNSDSAPAFSPAHPAVRRGLELILDGASKRGKEVICCGEMAAHPFYLLLLLAVGFRSLSVNHPFLPMVRFYEENLEEGQLKNFLDAIRSQKTLREIEKLFLTRLGSFFNERLTRMVVQAFRTGL
ncbi:MAG: phosphoenolpyruvate--protein phosphotransferase [Acidobacteria bacterium]|nr:phosphoenolpyruvate--protein phosphotransferase [Acidobacteriota bacterium]